MSNKRITAQLSRPLILVYADMMFAVMFVTGIATIIVRDSGRTE